jgi:hypothetical protein
MRDLYVAGIDGIDIGANQTSDKTKDAIVKGLANAMDKRPQTMVDFLHLFPECEDISFE